MRLEDKTQKHWAQLKGQYERLMALDDAAFARNYLEKMEEFAKEGWWGPGKMPVCSICREEIPGPKYMRRYAGRVIDAKCFPEFYAKNANETGIVRKYWERVAKLDITG